MTSWINPPSAGADAAAQAAIVDALYRFAAGQDLRDRALFHSAWTADAELDFTQPARRLGVELPPFRGREHITDAILGSVAPLTTSHSVANPRVQVEGDAARLFALVEAQHLPAGDHTRQLLLKNIYWCELAVEDGLWRIRRMRIENLWMDGDPRVLFPG